MTVRELKKQLQSEKKRAEKLQEKLKTVDTDQLVPPNGLALLDVPVQVVNLTITYRGLRIRLKWFISRLDYQKTKLHRLDLGAYQQNLTVSQY